MSAKPFVPAETDFEDLLTPEQAAHQLGLSAGTLSVWRCCKRFRLRYYKVGGRVRYRLSDLKNFVESRSVERLREVKPTGKGARRG